MGIQDEIFKRNRWQVKRRLLKSNHYSCIHPLLSYNIMLLVIGDSVITEGSNTEGGSRLMILFAESAFSRQIDIRVTGRWRKN